MILQREFKGKFKISFQPFLQKKECLVNATEMANAFDKRVFDYLKSEKTKAFILVLENELGNKNHAQNKDSQNDMRRSENSNYVCNLNGEETTISDNILKVKNGGSNNGTWLHRYLAVDFAMWLDPYFKYWLVSNIEALLYGYAKIHDSCLKEKLELKKEKKVILEKTTMTPEDYKRFFQIQQRLGELESAKRKALNAKVKEFEMDLFGDFTEQ